MASDFVRFWQGGTQIDSIADARGTDNFGNIDMYTHGTNSSGSIAVPSEIRIGMWFAATGSINLQNLEDAFETMYNNLNP